MPSKQTYGPCREDGCDRPAVYKEKAWCKSHYQSWWRHGHPNGAQRDPQEMPERHRRILELSGQGLSTGTIVEVLKVHARTVQRVRKLYGSSEMQMRRFTPEEIIRVEAMLDDGCSYSEIGRTLGRHERTISHRWPGRGWTKDQGADLRMARARARRALRDLGDPEWKDL